MVQTVTTTALGQATTTDSAGKTITITGITSSDEHTISAGGRRVAMTRGVAMFALVAVGVMPMGAPLKSWGWREQRLTRRKKEKRFQPL